MPSGLEDFKGLLEQDRPLACFGKRLVEGSSGNMDTAMRLRMVARAEVFGYLTVLFTSYGYSFRCDGDFVFRQATECSDKLSPKLRWNKQGTNPLGQQVLGGVW
jgi:hypothetical protein